ncbi:MAG TPA: FAD-dependent oxidoreductase [Streptosporangiaceae bacterium]|jgi:NADPH-dependent 2,4-dienoyl-CoA reductase/sulfur reductase-like enzyme|nr:FAD-dependent oxidoreductase [Streptosporangiaceae bacterium]
MTLADPVRPGRIVVAGGGLAGLRTVEELRARGYAGEVTLVAAEDRPPYDRPPLSKRLLAGEISDTTLRDDWAALDVSLRLGETAVGLDGAGGTGGGGGSESGEAAGVLRTDRGEHGYDRLVLATGATPVALPGPGPQRFLRTLDDALALRERLRPGLRLAIVGAGWIGAELATAAAARGCRVTVVEAGDAPLATALGAEVGAYTAPWYDKAGVELALNQPVASVEPGGLALAGGGWLAADEIVTAVGVRPAVSWLEDSGIALDRGVAVDEQLRATVAGVYAAGDCAAFWSMRFNRRLRTEHWDVALRAPAVLAQNLLGAAEPYDPVPYFWSEQFGRMVQYVGFHGGADQLVLRGDPAGPKWSACWLCGGVLVALLTVGIPRDLAQGRRLIEAAAAVDAARIADPDIPVRATAAD